MACGAVHCVDIILGEDEDFDFRSQTDLQTIYEQRYPGQQMTVIRYHYVKLTRKLTLWLEPK